MKRFLTVRGTLGGGGNEVNIHLDVSKIDEMSTSIVRVAGSDVLSVNYLYSGNRTPRVFYYRGTEEEFMGRVTTHLAAVSNMVGRQSNIRG